MHMYIPTMSSRQWEYYDFEKGWDTFYKIFSSPAVADHLMIDMEDYCGDIFVGYDWKPGQDLWQFSRGNYHWARLDNLQQEFIESIEGFKKFTESPRLNGINNSNTKDLSRQTLYDACKRNAPLEMFYPQKGSLTAQLLIGGESTLTFAIIETTKIMFPRSEYIVRNSKVFLVDEKIIIDFIGYYFWVNHKHYEFNPQTLGSATEEEYEDEDDDEDDDNDRKLELEVKIDGLEQLITERDSTILKLKNEMRLMVSQLRTSSLNMASLNRATSSADTEKTELKIKISNTIKTIQDKNKTIGSLEGSIRTANRDKLIKELKNDRKTL
jgi:hypothetical protein